MENQLNKKLNDKILPDFTCATDWSCLLTIIKKLKEILIKHKTANFFNIQNKIQLSKRLSQCLNSCLPDGLHESTLEIYELLLDNILVTNIFNNRKIMAN